jgi:hypothetical protein
MTIYHKHHIIPKHAGGTDDPSNIIQLTIEEHAEAHRQLYLKYGRWQDNLAWLGLSKNIGNDEIIKIKQIEGGKYISKKYPERASAGGKALWSKPGMREHLIQKRKEQSATGNNPMQGKKQKRVCCLFCKKETAFNTLRSNHKNCK